MARLFALTTLWTYIVLAVFARQPLASIGAFIPSYESVLVILYLMTAAILFGQAAILKSLALLALASGYLFAACLTIPHALTFPGLFFHHGILVASAQSTAWIYMLWHGGFPLFVIAYAVFKGKPSDARLFARGARDVVPWAVAAVVAIAVALTAVAMAARGAALPLITVNGHYTIATYVTASIVWLLALGAIVALWRRKPASVLDVWLIVVMCAWIADVGLAAVFNAHSFDLGFYTGRLYSVLAASCVLMLLMLENGTLYTRLVEAHEELRGQASADPLTGIANRRAFEETLNREWRRALRDNAALSVLMIDVDHFKKYNDAYGHVEGDQCLRTVAEVLSRIAKRSGDLAARYGGEEFAVILPGAEGSEAVRLGQRICDAIADMRIPHNASSVAEYVTISVGAASVRFHNSGGALLTASATIVEAADQALYLAKEQGRNRVCERLLDDERVFSDRPHGA